MGYKQTLKQEVQHGLRVLFMQQTCDFAAYIATIRKCRTIGSSSLHGLIFGAAVGVPGVHLFFSTKVIGAHWKFDDFYAGINFAEGYQFLDLRNSHVIPYQRIFEMAKSRPVPPIDLSELWAAAPFHAAALNVSRTELMTRAAAHLREQYKPRPYDLSRFGNPLVGPLKESLR